MLNGNQSHSSSGAVGDQRGKVRNVCPVQDRELIFDGGELFNGGLRVVEGIAHVVNVTPANVEEGDVFTILYGGIAIATFTATAATVKNVVEGLQAAWEANKASHPGPDAITATEDDTKVILTADEAGVPFTVTTSAVDGGGNDTQTLTAAVGANNDTGNVTTDPTHILGKTSIEFDKIDGSNGKKNAGVERSDLKLDLSRFTANDIIEGYIYISDKTDVAKVIVRLGTDATNYNQWELSDGDITQATWQQFKKALSACVVTVGGNGWDPSDVQYAAVMVEFDAQDDTLADMFLDHLMVRSVSPAS